MQSILKQPFTNVQLELLKTFSHQLPENDLIELKKAIALFFAEKLINQADIIWKENKWDDTVVNQILKTKLRKS